MKGAGCCSNGNETCKEIHAYDHYIARTLSKELFEKVAMCYVKSTQRAPLLFRDFKQTAARNYPGQACVLLHYLGADDEVQTKEVAWRLVPRSEASLEKIVRWELLTGNPKEQLFCLIINRGDKPEDQSRASWKIDC